MKDPTPTQTPGNEAPEEGLAGYPAGVMPILQALADQGGLLLADQSRRLAPWAGRDPARVAAYLLPFAAAFATAPISGFRVGAVVAARADGGGFTFYLGANMEFAGLCLQQTVHAETAAVIHAWHRGAADIAVIAVTEPPCGYCRQFLTELHNSRALTVAVAGRDGQPMRASTLDRLLPDAFGPRRPGQRGRADAARPRLNARWH